MRSAIRRFLSVMFCSTVASLSAGDRGHQAVTPGGSGQAADGDLTADALGVADTESPTDSNGSGVKRLAPLIELDRKRGRQRRVLSRLEPTGGNPDEAVVPGSDRLSAAATSCGLRRRCRMLCRVEPFAIRVADRDLDDLADRLTRTRWPAELPPGWDRGTDPVYLRRMVQQCLPRRSRR
jgi:hypothetical protein